MFHWLIQIPGPQFLWIFAVFSIVVIFVGWLISSRDNSMQYPLPEPTQLSPMAIAVLRETHGIVGAIQVAFFSLWNKQLVRFGSDKHYVERVSSPSQPQDPIEREIYDFLQTPQKLMTFFVNKDLHRRLVMPLQSIYRELEQLHLIRSSAQRGQSVVVTIVVILIILAFGGTKLFFGVTRGYPSSFLTVLLIVAIFTALLVLKPNRFVTKLGRTYLKSLRSHFDWAIEAAKKGEDLRGIQPTMLLAVFGILALSGTQFFEPYYSLVHSYLPAGSGVGSSSDGGGGCSGGGCGGGSGCGGCGGGGD